MLLEQANRESVSVYPYLGHAFRIMTESTATSDAQCAIVVFKKTGGAGMRWEFDTRNWCAFGSHKDCDIQIRTDKTAPLQALVKFFEGRLWLQTLSTNKQTVLPSYGPLEEGSEIPLEDGNFFTIAGRLFCVELTTGPDSSSSSSDVVEICNPDGKDLSRSTRVKSRDFSTTTSGKTVRRTSLVVTDTEQIFVESTTDTKLFPSSVLHTPSKLISEKLHRVASPISNVQNEVDQEIRGQKIKLSYPSGENASTKLTRAVNEDRIPTPDRRVYTYSTDEGGYFRFDRDARDSEAYLPLGSEKKVKPGPPILFQNPGIGEKLNPPSKDAKPLIFQRKTGNEPAPMLDGKTEASDREHPQISFSRWPRKEKNMVGTPIQVNNTSDTNLFSKSNAGNAQPPTARVPSETISALAKKQMAYDRLSQGLPATPMKWETGLGSNRFQRRTGNIIRTPNGNIVKRCALLGSVRRTPSQQRPLCETGTENLPAVSQLRSNKEVTNVKSQDSNAKADCPPAKSPGLASRDTSLTVGPVLMPQDQEPQSPITRSTAKHTQSAAEGAAQSSRRSVLFNDFELEQGPHYSPGRIRPRSRRTSKLLSTAESISLGSHPQPPPLSRSSEEDIPLNRVQGPPPTQKLQELGTFFYPGNGRNAYEPAGGQEMLSPTKRAEDSPGSNLSPDIKQPNFESGSVDGTVSVHDEVSSEENSSSSGSLPLCSNEFGSPQASFPGIQEENLLFSADQQHQTAENVIDSQGLVGSRVDCVDDNAGISNPRRRSILGAMLDVAKAVTERFSMGRVSSSASVEDRPSERIDFDPEDMETASESDDSFDPEDIETSSESSNSDGNVDHDPSKVIGIRTEPHHGQHDYCEDESEAKTHPTLNLSSEHTPIINSFTSTYDPPNVHPGATGTTRGEDEEILTGSEASDRHSNSDELEEVGDLEKFRKMKFAALRRHLKKLGLDTTGKKDMLLQRLGEYLSTQKESSVDIGSVGLSLNLQEADVPEECTSPMQLEKETPLEKAGNGDLYSDGAVALQEDSEVKREEYQVRTVKELLGFMKKHELLVPQRIKKADLIDLVIANGIDSDGHRIVSRHLETPHIGVSNPGSQKSRVNQKGLEAAQATPAMRSTRQKGKAEPSTAAKEAGPDMGSSLKVLQDSSKKLSAAAIAEASSVPATPLRSTRKRKPVNRFEG